LTTAITSTLKTQHTWNAPLPATVVISYYRFKIHVSYKPGGSPRVGAAAVCAGLAMEVAWALTEAKQLHEHVPS